MRGTLNAEEAMRLAGDVRVEVEVDVLGSTLPVDVTVRAVTGTEEVWRTELPAFDPDDSVVAGHDYRGAHWDAARMVILGGRDEAYLLDARDGAVLRALRLGSRSMSLDFVSVFVPAGAAAAVIACSKVVWVVDAGGEVVFEFPSAGPCDVPVEVAPGQLLIRYLDVELPEAPWVDRVVDLRALIANR